MTDRGMTLFTFRSSCCSELALVVMLSVMLVYIKIFSVRQTQYNLLRYCIALGMNFHPFCNGGRMERHAF